MSTFAIVGSMLSHNTGYGRSVLSSQLPETILTPDFTVHSSRQFKKKKLVSNVIAKGYDTNHSQKNFKYAENKFEIHLDFRLPRLYFYPTREATKITAKFVYEKVYINLYTCPVG